MWLSPIGWSQATHPLGADATGGRCSSRVVAAALLVALAGLAAAARDVGAGLVARATRPRRRRARSLAGPFGLALRTAARPRWSAGRCGLFALGAVVRLARPRASRTWPGSNPTLEEYFRAAGQGSLRRLVPRHDAAGARAAGRRVRRVLGAAAAPARRPPAGSSRCSPPGCPGPAGCSGTPGRHRCWAARRCCSPPGPGLGATYAVSTSDPSQLLRIAGLELVYLPAVLVPAGARRPGHGLAPGRGRASPGCVLAVWFVLGYLGGLLHAPDWLVRTSPFSHTPAVPVAPVSLARSARRSPWWPSCWRPRAVQALRRRDLVTHCTPRGTEIVSKGNELG